MNKKTIIPVVMFLLVLSFTLAKKTHAIEFDPNNIITDEEILDYKTMSLKDVQDFLKNRGGYLANYSCADADGDMKTAAQIIFEASTNNYDCDEAMNLSDNPTDQEKMLKCNPVRMNPQFILVLLQKEQSLIESASPRQSQLDWALGYGCPDGVACYERWRGFGKQVNSAILQFYDYIAHPKRYKYQVGQAYTVTNSGREPSTIIPMNLATAGLYNYTPHVYNGNYNFFNLWKRYFTRDYPNGSLLQSRSGGGVWLIQDGKKRPFQSRGALTSRFDINKIILVNQSIIDNYQLGDPIKFAQYSVVRMPKGSIYLIVDDKKRPFTSMEAFRKIGINPEEIIDATLADLSLYTDSEPITATTTYPTGALLQNSKTGGVYWVTDNTKAPVLDAVFLKTKFKYKAIHPMDPAKLDKYITVGPVLFGDGELLKSYDSPAVYVIDSGAKRPFLSGEIFEAMGYKWSNVINVSSKIIKLYPDSMPVIDTTISTTTEEVASSSPIIQLNTSSSTTDIIATSTISSPTSSSTISAPAVSTTTNYNN